MKCVTLFIFGHFFAHLQAGGWAYFLSYHDKSFCKSGAQLNTTSECMQLNALMDGLSQLKVPCLVNVFCNGRYLKNMVQNNKEGFNGELFHLCKKHIVEVKNNSYEECEHIAGCEAMGEAAATDLKFLQENYMPGVYCAI